MSTPADPGARARNRAALQARLRDVGRRHLAEHGAAALSLRAVARDMGRTPSSLYRYVRDRDDLLTVLIVDAYDDLGDALDGALDGVAGARSRFEAFANALRAWAIEHPSEYALLYGSPVPGYHAPAVETTRAGTRPVLALVGIVQSTDDVPPLRDTDARRQAAAASALRETAAEVDVAPDVLARTLTVWNLLLGAISAELFEQLGVLTDRPDDLWQGTVDIAGALLPGGRASAPTSTGRSAESV